MKLSQKMKYIIKELDTTQDTFIKEIQKQNKEQSTTMSESSLKKIFSGKPENYRPSLTTVDKIVNYLKTLNNSKFKYISYDYLLNNSNINISNENIKINELTGLTDETIQNIKNINKQNNTTLNNFINGINKEFWKSLRMLEDIKEYKKISLQLKEITPSKFEEFRSTLIKKMNLQDIIFPENRPTLHDFESNNDIYIPTIESTEFKLMLEIFDLAKNKIELDTEYRNFYVVYDTSRLEKQIKYQISEYLTLYMNN